MRDSASLRTGRTSRSRPSAMAAGSARRRLPARCRGRCCALAGHHTLHEARDVFLRNAALRTRTLHACDFDAETACELAHRRRRGSRGIRPTRRPAPAQRQPVPGRPSPVRRQVPARQRQRPEPVRSLRCGSRCACGFEQHDQRAFRTPNRPPSPDLFTTPAAEAGTSIVALSDSSVTSDCSFSTVSPTFTPISITGTSLRSRRCRGPHFERAAGAAGAAARPEQLRARTRRSPAPRRRLRAG